MRRLAGIADHDGAGRQVAVDHEPAGGVVKSIGKDEHKERRLSEIGQHSLA